MVKFKKNVLWSKFFTPIPYFSPHKLFHCAFPKVWFGCGCQISPLCFSLITFLFSFPTCACDWFLQLWLNWELQVVDHPWTQKLCTVLAKQITYCSYSLFYSSNLHISDLCFLYLLYVMKVSLRTLLYICQVDNNYT